MQKSKSFKQLQNKWYKKLKDSGFTDIEQESKETELTEAGVFSTTYRLKQWHSTQFKQIYTEDKERYYQLATHFYNDHKFKNKKEQFIWLKHSEGLDSVEIAKELLKSGIKVPRSTIWYIVNKLSKIMLPRK